MRIAVGSLFILGACALPNVFERAATCSRDNCYRAVVASSAAPGNAKGSADCSSFFRKTVTPCPVTTTSTSTSTPIISSTATIVTSTTLTTTITVLVPVTVINTITQTTTGTQTVFTTVTTTVTAAQGNLNKREAFAVNALNLPRVVAACSTTSSPSNIPSYASACSGTARYSSACSCNGISQYTTTLAPVISSVTTTTTVSPVTTIVDTTISTSSVTTTEFTSVRITTVGTSTVTVSAMTTTTSTVTMTATMSSAPRCTFEYGNLQEGCDDGSFCDSPHQCAVVANENTCGDVCIDDSSCIAYGFDTNSGSCETYYECCPNMKRDLLINSGSTILEPYNPLLRFKNAQGGF